MDWVLKDLIPQASGMRRSAIVVMTDGIDNALPDVPGPGSSLPFEGLIERIRNSETIVFPIYLDTEEENVKRHHVPRSAYALAREQLGQMAAVCGTPLYRAARLSDLDAVYAQVVRDLSTVYSIGYQPTNKTLDGKWRSVEVRLMNRSDLFARTKRGYYAKTAEFGLLKLVSFPEPTIMLVRFVPPTILIARIGGYFDEKNFQPPSAVTTFSRLHPLLFGRQLCPKQTAKNS